MNSDCDGMEPFVLLSYSLNHHNDNKTPIVSIKHVKKINTKYFTMKSLELFSENIKQK